jgi:hypothetical protein
VVRMVLDGHEPRGLLRVVSGLVKLQHLLPLELSELEIFLLEVFKQPSNHFSLIQSLILILSLLDHIFNLDVFLENHSLVYISALLLGDLPLEVLSEHLLVYQLLDHYLLTVFV